MRVNISEKGSRREFTRREAKKGANGEVGEESAVLECRI